MKVNFWLINDFIDYQEVKKDVEIAFGSSSPRFMFKRVFYGQNLKMNPGPGHYEKDEDD